MKENTSATVPGTTVKISIMKTIEGGWKVTRTPQLGIARYVNLTFNKNSEREARMFADLLWTNTVNARNAQISTADEDAHMRFTRAQVNDGYIIEMRLD